ncbi:MAG: peptide chain release factor N(5)-glutamine methyltransferase [Patescibacteria group bacterium]
MTIKTTLQNSLNKLKKAKIKSAHLDAEVLLSFLLKKTRSFLYIWPDKTITKEQESRYKQLIARRLKGEPVAYLIKNKEFYGLNFYVDKNVLIPRPETECLIEEIIKFSRHANGNKRLAICDIGTGSGCLAVTLKKYIPKAKIYASDISKEALAVAKKNAGKHKVKILFKQGNLLKPFKKTKLDLIVANLPYLKPLRKYLKNYPGLKYEPQIALSAGKQGLDLYREFFSQLKKYQPQAKVFIEIDPSQVKAIRRIILKNLHKARIEIKKDLSGRDRIAIIK